MDWKLVLTVIAVIILPFLALLWRMAGKEKQYDERMDRNMISHKRHYKIGDELKDMYHDLDKRTAILEDRSNRNDK